MKSSNDMAASANSQELEFTTPSSPTGGEQTDSAATPSRRPNLPNDYLRPQSPLHEVLVAAWEEILNMEEIGVQDDFFELGGDSILAVQLITQLRQMFGMDLHVVCLFEAPTVERLAQFMIQNEPRPGLIEKTAGLLKQIEGMTEEEVSRSLRSKSDSVSLANKNAD